MDLRGEVDRSDGWRYQLLATNTPDKTAQFLEARHRPHARVEDCTRTGKDTGLATCLLTILALPTNPMLITRVPAPTWETIRTPGIRRPPEATTGPPA